MEKETECEKKDSSYMEEEEVEKWEEFHDCSEVPEGSGEAAVSEAVEGSSGMGDDRWAPFQSPESQAPLSPTLPPPLNPHFIDETHLAELEQMMSDEEKQEQREIAAKMKKEGNQRFGSGLYEEAQGIYTEALLGCPPSFSKERAVLYGNRAACFIKLEDFKQAIADCDCSLKLDPAYGKVLYRRAWCLEKEEDSWDRALSDYKALLQLEPHHRKALESISILEKNIAERNERMKDEMLGKLKDLGNMVLGRWGMSTDNFKLEQGPDGGYSVKMQ